MTTRSFTKTLRPYQEDVLTYAKEQWAAGTTNVVIAACPSSGKTTMAGKAIYETLERNEKVLVFAHGTTVLRSQWYEEVLKNLYADGEDKISELGNDPEAVYELLRQREPNLTIILPHTVHANPDDYGKHNLVVVDEAHEFYFAPMVQGALSVLAPDRTLLLTGTPSKFIMQNCKDVQEDRPETYKIKAVSAMEIYNQGTENNRFLSNTYFGMVRSAHNCTDADYNDLGDLKEGVQLSSEKISTDIKNLFDVMYARLSDVYHVPNPEWSIKKGVKNVIRWGNRELDRDKFHKTLIACKDIQHATNVAEGLRKILSEDEVLLSESLTDLDSSNIGKFKTDPKVKVLVVVNRAILGFDMPELANVVDMTGSKNIDRIYQLYARVLRVSTTGVPKRFFRLCMYVQPAVDIFYITAALNLAEPQFLLAYNGKNLSTVPILMPTKLKEAVDMADEDGMITEYVDPDTLTQEQRQEYIDNGATYVDVIGDAPLATPEYITATGDLTIDQIHDIECNGIGSLQSSETDCEESSTAEGTGVVIKKRVLRISRDLFDVVVSSDLFSKQDIDLGKIWDEFQQVTFGEVIKKLTGRNFHNSAGNKEAIKQFCIDNGRRPSATSKDATEKKLGQSMGGYLGPSRDTYDEQFKIELDELCPSTINPAGNKDAIKQFCIDNGRRPSRSSKDAAEKKLGQSMRRYLSQSNGSYDEQFKIELDELCPGTANPAGNKDAIKQFCIDNGRRPSRSSKDAAEKKLCGAMKNYVSQSNGSYDEQFKIELDELHPSVIDTSMSSAEKKDAIKQFCIDNGRRPSQHSKDTTEKKLGQSMHSYTSPTNGAYDEQFKRELDELCPSTRKRKAGAK